jgi:hypothetical protein
MATTTNRTRRHRAQWTERAEVQNGYICCWSARAAGALLVLAVFRSLQVSPTKTQNPPLQHTDDSRISADAVVAEISSL